jgi:hypothetical protein
LEFSHSLQSTERREKRYGFRDDRFSKMRRIQDQPTRGDKPTRGDEPARFGGARPLDDVLRFRVFDGDVFVRVGLRGG